MPPKKKIKANSLEIPTSALECPVCLDVIKDPPIFQCENSSSHSVCYKCHDALLKDKKPCPVCRQPLAFRRNIALENIVEGFPNKIKCKFDGCGFKRSSREAVKEHEDECEYRCVPCAYCEAKIALRAIIEHLKTHRMGNPEGITLEGFSKPKRLQTGISSPKIEQTVLRVEGGEHHPAFLLNINCWKNAPTIVWVSCVTPKKSLAKNYVYNFRVQSAKKDETAGKTISVSLKRCVPCDLSHDEVRKMHMYTVLDKETIADALAHDDEKRLLTFVITISKF